MGATHAVGVVSPTADITPRFGAHFGLGVEGGGPRLARHVREYRHHPVHFGIEADGEPTDRAKDFGTSTAGLRWVRERFD